MSDWPGEIDKCEYHLLKSKKMSDEKQSTGTERLPKQECPVRVAENDAIAEQIERDFSDMFDKITDEQLDQMSFTDVAVLSSMHQDKIATNRTVEQAIQIIRMRPGRFETDADQRAMIEELEKLKK